ncbi:MAG: hypothetical protein P8171_13275 [Candidatus Thiodiazotropha sp.]
MRNRIAQVVTGRIKPPRLKWGIGGSLNTGSRLGSGIPSLCDETAPERTAYHPGRCPGETHGLAGWCILNVTGFVIGLKLTQIPGTYSTLQREVGPSMAHLHDLHPLLPGRHKRGFTPNISTG